MGVPIKLNGEVCADQICRDDMVVVLVRSSFSYLIGVCSFLSSPPETLMQRMYQNRKSNPELSNIVINVSNELFNTDVWSFLERERGQGWEYTKQLRFLVVGSSEHYVVARHYYYYYYYWVRVLYCIRLNHPSELCWVVRPHPYIIALRIAASLGGKNNDLT